MTATRINDGSTGKAVLHLAFELGTGKWKLGFMVGHGEKPRLVLSSTDTTVATINYDAWGNIRKFSITPIY